MQYAKNLSKYENTIFWSAAILIYSGYCWKPYFFKKLTKPSRDWEVNVRRKSVKNRIFQKCSNVHISCFYACMSVYKGCKGSLMLWGYFVSKLRRGPTNRLRRKFVADLRSASVACSFRSAPLALINTFGDKFSYGLVKVRRILTRASGASSGTRRW